MHPARSPPDPRQIPSTHGVCSSVGSNPHAHAWRVASGVIHPARPTNPRSCPRASDPAHALQIPPTRFGSRPRTSDPAPPLRNPGLPLNPDELAKVAQKKDLSKELKRQRKLMGEESARPMGGKEAGTAGAALDKLKAKPPDKLQLALEYLDLATTHRVSPKCAVFHARQLEPNRGLGRLQLPIGLPIGQAAAPNRAGCSSQSDRLQLPIG